MTKLTRRQFTAGAAATVAAPFGLTNAQAQNFGGTELIEAARKEGKIVYYTADFTEPEQVLIKEFNRRFPFVRSRWCARLAASSSRASGLRTAPASCSPTSSITPTAA